MSNLLVKLTFPCVTLLGVILLLFQTPTYTHADLRALILPPTDCSAPCFIGIRPGITTVEAALQVLQVNPLIQSIKVSSFDRYDTQSAEASVMLPLEQLPLLLDAHK